jgi:hypothetical protein
MRRGTIYAPIGPGCHGQVPIARAFGSPPGPLPSFDWKLSACSL